MDRIEKQVVLRAPRSRVWRAISNAGEFGAWFRCAFEGEFSPGAKLRARLKVPGYENIMMEIEVDRIEPERLFSYRWHPFAVDPKVDYSPEPMTLVEFRLDEVAGGTRLTVVESGFDKLPASRRDLAFRMNDGGWAAQLGNVEKHVSP